MLENSLDTFIAAARATWGPLTTELVQSCQRSLAQLARAPATEPWLAALDRDAPDDRELYRDPAHGFVLLAHVERAGRYRAPHDHGHGWVLYAVRRGEIEMRSYRRVIAASGEVTLVRRDSAILRAGECRAYLPSDIHDTRARSEEVLLLRWTSCDLKREALEGRLTRYPAEPE